MARSSSFGRTLQPLEDSRSANTNPGRPGPRKRRNPVPMRGYHARAKGPFCTGRAVCLIAADHPRRHFDRSSHGAQHRPPHPLSVPEFDELRVTGVRPAPAIQGIPAPTSTVPWSSPNTVPMRRSTIPGSCSKRSSSPFLPRERAGASSGRNRISVFDCF